MCVTLDLLLIINLQTDSKTPFHTQNAWLTLILSPPSTQPISRTLEAEGSLCKVENE